MKIAIKFLVFLVMLQGVIFATSINPETQFTSGINEATKCAIQCPPMKEGYFGRVANFNYETGTTTCYVYNSQEPTNIVGKVVNINQHCSNELINPNKVNRISSNTSGVNSHLNSLEDKFNDLYVNTGTTTYLNLSKYMVAGLMADDEIINIPTSITTNEIVLNNGYTIAPNIANVDSIANASLISRTKDALSNSITFIINFFAKSDKILTSFQVTIFLFVVSLSLILFLTQKTTKKISKISDHEDMVEKLLFGLISILIFFLPMNKITTSSGDISQTGYQQLVRPLLYLGVATADKLTETATSSVLKYKFDAIGINLQNDISSLEDLLWTEKQKNIYFNNMLDKCKSIYNIPHIMNYTKLLNSNLSFPPSEEIFTKGYGNDEKRAITFYTKTMMNDESFIKKNELPTVSYCYQVERSVLSSNSFILNLNQKINNYKSAVSNEMENKINLMVDLTYKNIADLGFVSIINLGTTMMAFDQFSLLGQNQNKQENYEFNLENFRNQSGYEIQGFAKPDDVGGLQGMINVATNEVFTNAPYYMFVPFADNLMNFINTTFAPVKKAGESTGEIINLLLNWIPVVGNSLGKGAEMLVSKGIDFAVDSAKGYLTTYLIVKVIAILPLIAIIAGGILVITFYFLSITILYIIIPFASIFAFSTGNVDIIKNLIKHTLLLSVKPVLIVVSVVMAMFVYEMISSLNQVLVSSMFEPLFALSNNSSGTSNIDSFLQTYGAGGIFLFLKSTFLLASSFVTIFTCFYLVFNGSNIMLDLLGMRDGGFDIGGIIGDKIEGKQAISKLNTVV